MSFFRNRSAREANEGTKAPPVEIWDHFLSTHRFFRRLAVACIVLAGVGLAGGAYGLLIAMNEPLVFAIDTEGRSTSLGRREALSQPLDAEIRFVAKQYLQKTLAFRSETIEADLADAMNLMTRELRERTETEFRDYEAKNREPFVAWVKKQGIVTRIELKDLAVENANGSTVTVTTTALLRTPLPSDDAFPDSAETVRKVDVRLTLVRVPRTESTPHGLLVSGAATRFHKAPTKEPSLEQKAKALPAPGSKQ